MRSRIHRFIPAFLLIAFSAIPAAAEFTEVSRLAALAKVWGFLKYYHPNVAKGQIDWDERLVDAIPGAESAANRADFNAVLNRLIADAGGVNFLNFPRPVPRRPTADPLFGWMKDATLFAPYTVLKLELLLENVPVPSNAYCKYVFDAGNLDFSYENKYSSPAYPDQGHRLLALFRYWNIIYYFYPYMDIIECDWQDILDEFIPKIGDAGGALDYHLAVRELTARLNDSHASTGSSVLSSQWWGLYYPPFEVKYVEGQTIVTKIYTHLPVSAGGLAVGDIVLSADGVPVAALRNDKAPYVEASNEPTRQRNLNKYIFRGPKADLHLTVQRNGQEMGIDLTRCYYSDYSTPQDPGPVWSVLPGDIGYVNMGILEVAQVDAMMAQLKNTRAIIFDIRNYPKGTMFAIGEYLNPNPREFVKFTYPDLDSPGRFLWSETVSVGPAVPNPDYYKGLVVVLINETTQSHAEYTTMSLQAAPQTIVIGSQTAGADGNVSIVYLPGGIYTYFTGLGVYYPDGRGTQRIGIVPDIESKPTILGIRSGLDEVLQRALDTINQHSNPETASGPKEGHR